MPAYLQLLTTPTGRRRHSDAKPIYLKMDELADGESIVDVVLLSGVTLDEIRKVYYMPREAKLESILQYLGRYGKVDIEFTRADGQKYRLVV